MAASTKVILSLGSNQGNKIWNLQSAIFQIGDGLGEVYAISGVYQNAAWGFEGDDFLNICVGLHSNRQPEAILDEILKIERRMGRERSADGSYSSRTIDIDILYYGEEVIRTDRLVIPHPHLTERRFVLRPLADVAPQFYHPELNKDSRNLLQECRDPSKLEKTTLNLYATRQQLMAQIHFLAIEGNIGAGKTTLARKISEQYNAKLVLERFADNPFLPKFYRDPGRYAFPLEMSFLADRYQQFSDDTSQFDLFKEFMVSDYDIFKSLIFAQVTLQHEEFGLYRKLFNFMYKEVRKPDLYVYLYQQTPRLLENIRRRGRDYEQEISPEYLDQINRGYLDFIKSYPHKQSLIIDISEVDFVENPYDYDNLVEKILENLAGI